MRIDRVDPPESIRHGLPYALLGLIVLVPSTFGWAVAAIGFAAGRGLMTVLFVRARDADAVALELSSSMRSVQVRLAAAVAITGSALLLVSWQ